MSLFKKSPADQLRALGRKKKNNKLSPKLARKVICQEDVGIVDLVAVVLEIQRNEQTGKTEVEIGYGLFDRDGDILTYQGTSWLTVGDSLTLTQLDKAFAVTFE